MTTLPSQFLYQLIVNNIAPIMASGVTSVYSSYFTNTPSPTVVRHAEADDERELDLLQMDRLLKWMNLIFVEKTTNHEDQKQYKKELYNIFMTISSDYKQYQEWKKYNYGIYLFSSYRKKDTKGLARKILGDVKLFNEGLNMFSMFEKI